MNSLDYFIVIVYAIGFLGLGYLFKEQKNKKDYFLGGRRFGWFPLSLSTMATQLSAISFISAPAFVGMRQGGGMHWLSFEFAVPLAMIFLMLVLIPPLYKSGIISVYEYLEKRFDASSRLLLSFVFQISRAFQTGVMVYAVALILTSVLEIPFWQTVIIIGLITIIYSYLGGMKAVVYGDVIQLLILFLGIMICFGFGLHYLGGWSKLIAQVEPARLVAVDISSFGFREGQEFGFWPMVLGGFFLYTSYYGTDQTQVQRILSANSLKTARLTLLVNGILRFPITFCYCIMGLIIGTFALSEPAFLEMIPADKPDLMIPVFIRDYLPHGVIGLLIIAILSAAMSSLSSTINSLSAVTVEDFIARGKKLKHEQYVWYSRITVLFWGSVCIILAFFTGNIAETVIEAINKVGSVFYGPILSTFIAAILIRRIHAFGANIGLLTGVAVNVYLWLGIGESLFWFWWNAIGALVTLLTAFLVSALVKRPVKESNILQLAPIDLKGKEVPILLGYFVLMVVFSVCLPIFF